MLIAPRSVAVFQGANESPFEPDFWAASGRLTPAARGRGSAWFIGADREQWALRHYRRGGWVAVQFSLDRYLWTGEERVRAFLEWRLLETLVQRGLPVPEPIAARYRRGRFAYRCDLITRRIPDAEPMSDVLTAAPLPPARWHAIGATIARFHAAGVDHADLNAHNILLDGQGVISIVDFDRGRLRSPGPWRSANLRRLLRSLCKISAGMPSGRFGSADWSELMAGYGSAS
jgi:3-deoxy-D-manno-octulosonic acid kinase